MNKEKQMRDYQKKRHELVERLVKATTVEECLQIGREFDEASDKMNNADRELYLTEATGNARLDRGIDEKVERLRNPEKYKAYILDPPPDIPADKVDRVERERLKQEYLGKLNDIVRRAKEARTIDEILDLEEEQFRLDEKLKHKDPALYKEVIIYSDKYYHEIEAHMRKLKDPEKYKAYILDPPDIPADKVDLVERERLKQEYLGKLNDIVRRAKEARTIDECVELRRQILEETIKLRQNDPELCRNLKTNTTKAHEQVNEQEKTGEKQV